MQVRRLADTQMAAMRPLPIVSTVRTTYSTLFSLQDCETTQPLLADSLSSP